MLDACRRRSSTGNAARPRSAADLADKISDVSAGRSINSRLRYFKQKLPEKLMSPEAYLAGEAPPHSVLAKHVWILARPISVAGVAPDCIDDLSCSSAIICTVSIEFLESRLFQCDWSKGRNGALGAGAALFPNRCCQRRTRHHLGLGSHGNSAHMARVAERSSL